MGKVIELAGVRRKLLDEHEDKVWAANAAEVTRAGWEELFPVRALEQMENLLGEWYGDTDVPCTYRIAYDETTGTFWFYSTFRAGLDLIKSGEKYGPMVMVGRDISAMLSVRWINPDFMRVRQAVGEMGHQASAYTGKVRGFYHEDLDAGETMELDMLLVQFISRMMTMGYSFEEPIAVNGPIEGFVGEQLLFFRATLDNEIVEFYLDGHTAVSEAQALIKAEEERDGRKQT